MKREEEFSGVKIDISDIFIVYSIRQGKNNLLYDN